MTDDERDEQRDGTPEWAAEEGSRRPSPELLDYATTKAGIANFTKRLAQDLADKGIRVRAASR